ncbi:MAG: hypothetical protein AAFN94_15180 [Pseudomonadota bacterium]
MSARQIFHKLEQIYLRRKKIEAARKSALDRQLAAQDRTIATLELQRTEMHKTHAAEIATVLQSAETALHYNTMLSALAAKKVRQHDEMALLRYDTLRRREMRDQTAEEAASQRDLTRNATRQAEKIKLLRARETAADEARREVAEEEETAEAQSSKAQRRKAAPHA